MSLGTQWSAEAPGCANGGAFNDIAHPSPTTTTAFLGANQVGQFSGFTDLSTPEPFWYGFENMRLDRIEMNVALSNGSIGIDTVQVGVVPEPATVGLMTSRLFAPGVAAKRRKLS